MYENLEVVHTKNDDLKAQLDEVKDHALKMEEMNRGLEEQIRIVEEEKLKLENENEKLNKMSKLLKGQNSEDIL